MNAVNGPHSVIQTTGRYRNMAHLILLREGCSTVDVDVVAICGIIGRRV